MLSIRLLWLFATASLALGLPTLQSQNLDNATANLGIGPPAGFNLAFRDRDDESQPASQFFLQTVDALQTLIYANFFGEYVGYWDIPRSALDIRPWPHTRTHMKTCYIVWALQRAAATNYNEQAYPKFLANIRAPTAQGVETVGVFKVGSTGDAQGLRAPGTFDLGGNSSSSDTTLARTNIQLGSPNTGEVSAARLKVKREPPATVNANVTSETSGDSPVARPPVWYATKFPGSRPLNPEAAWMTMTNLMAELLEIKDRSRYASTDEYKRPDLGITVAVVLAPPRASVTNAMVIWGLSEIVANMITTGKMMESTTDINLFNQEPQGPPIGWILVKNFVNST